MKRFYKAAEASADAVLLDGKPVRTPGKNPLRLPTPALATAVAAEWAAQGEAILPETMPLTALASTAIDAVGPRRADITAAVARYGESDLLCYRADDDAALAEKQAQVWQPLLDWAARTHDAPLTVARGIMPVDQPAAAVAALRRAVEAADDWRLTALQLATGASGSLVIGLALLDGRIDADEAFEAAETDASWQIARWGEDAEATARRAALRADLAAARRFAALARTS